MNARVLWSLIKQTFAEWYEDKVPGLGAALAYYSVFSIAPLLLISIAFAGLLFERSAAQQQIIEQVQGFVGEDAARAIEKMIEKASAPATSTWALVTGLLVLVFGAGGAFGQLQDALNTIWEVAPRPGRGLKGIIRDRFLSFTMVLGVAFLLLVSLVISAAIAAVSGFFGDFLGRAIAHVVNFVASFGVTTILFAMIYKILPDREVAWRDVWIGAVVTSVLFTAGKFVIGIYLGRSGVTSIFGAAGSLVGILLWVYYSSQILLLGAEFTQVYANRFNSRIRPTANAISLSSEDRAQQGIPSPEHKSRPRRTSRHRRRRSPTEKKPSLTAQG
jgi:membrane protein